MNIIDEINKEITHFNAKKITYKEAIKSDYVDTPCWECTSHATNSKGFHNIRIGNKKKVKISRYVFSRENKMPLDGDYIVRHKCDNILCINPDHLESGTVADNMMDMLIRQKPPASKLRKDQVREIKMYIIQGISDEIISMIFGCSRSNITMIRLGYTWNIL